VYLLGGGVGLPAGLFQNPSEDDVALLAGSCNLADQKLVSLTDFPSGRSRMKRPSWSCVQKPCVTALAVQTYVFCWEIKSPKINGK
jgi:hypothetical protein